MDNFSIMVGQKIHQCRKTTSDLFWAWTEEASKKKKREHFPPFAAASPSSPPPPVSLANWLKREALILTPKNICWRGGWGGECKVRKKKWQRVWWVLERDAGEKGGGRVGEIRRGDKKKKTSWKETQRYAAWMTKKKKNRRRVGREGGSGLIKGLCCRDKAERHPGWGRVN